MRILLDLKQNYVYWNTHFGYSPYLVQKSTRTVFLKYPGSHSQFSGDMQTPCSQLPPQMGSHLRIFEVPTFT